MQSKHGKQWRQKISAGNNQNSIHHQVTNAVVDQADGNAAEASHAREEQPEERAVDVNGATAKTPSQLSAQANHGAGALDEEEEQDEEEADAEEGVQHPVKVVVNPSDHLEAPVVARKIAQTAREVNEARARVRPGIARRRRNA